MSAEKTWLPFGESVEEENPFYFSLARKSMQHSIRMCWTSMPDPSVAKLEAQMKSMLEELLREAREDAARHGVK